MEGEDEGEERRRGRRKSMSTSAVKERGKESSPIDILSPPISPYLENVMNFIHNAAFKEDIRNLPLRSCA